MTARFTNTIGFTHYASYTSSTTFTVPAGVYQLGFKMVGGGGNGSSHINGGEGGSGGSFVGGTLFVVPGQELDFTIGASAGTSLIERDSYLLAAAPGGENAVGQTRGGTVLPVAFNSNFFIVAGGRGGESPSGFSLGATNEEVIPYISGGARGFNVGGGYNGGGGGGASLYGAGGDGGDGAANNAGDGETPPSTSYGAGGGGGGGAPSSRGLGGQGVQGFLEIWY